MTLPQDLLDPKHYAGTRRPVEEASTLPPWAYYSPRFYEAERERIFLRAWNFVGHGGRIPNSGDYAAFDLAGVLKMVDGGQLSRHDLRQYLHHLTAVGFPFFFRMAKQMGEHSARDILSSVACPALIIAAEYDSFTPPRLAREMADRIEDSRLVWLKGASHAGIVEQPETINAAVETFLSEKILPRR